MNYIYSEMNEHQTTSQPQLNVVSREKFSATKRHKYCEYPNLFFKVLIILFLVLVLVNEC